MHAIGDDDEWTLLPSPPAPDPGRPAENGHSAQLCRAPTPTRRQKRQGGGRVRARFWHADSDARDRGNVHVERDHIRFKVRFPRTPRGYAIHISTTRLRRTRPRVLRGKGDGKVATGDRSRPRRRVAWGCAVALTTPGVVPPAVAAVSSPSFRGRTCRPAPFGAVRPCRAFDVRRHDVSRGD